MYQPRVLEASLKRYLSAFPVVGITGPRQSGKSTLLLNTLADTYQYVTFDDGDVLSLFENDPKKFMRIYRERAIFDEVQKVPGFFDAIKLVVDQNRQTYGQFILTGSSQFTLLKGIKESLSGRIGLLTLLPFQYRELPLSAQKNAVFLGSYPEPVLNQYRYVREWQKSYITTYLEKDVALLHGVDNHRDFRRLLELLAANTSQILNMSHYATDLGVSLSTIKRWIAILEASYIIFLLPPYFNNLGKRIVKCPKLYFYDTGLAAHLTGISTYELYEKGPMSGALFENYVIAEILKKEMHDNTDASLYYYRTSNGVEVDLIVDRKQYREWIEIKKTATFHPRITNPIESLMSENDKGYLLFQGQETPYLPNVFVIPFEKYLI